MKNFFLIAFFLLLKTTVFSQNFEGYILYSYQYLDSAGNNITNSMGKERALEQNYFINANNYKGIDEKGQIVQLYNSKTNTYFFQQGTKIKSISGSIEYPKEFKYETTKDTATIAGYLCKSIIVSTENGQTTYFFNESISIDYNNFKNHRFGNWGNYLKASNGSLPLKFIVKNEDYIMIATATIVKKQKLDENEFDIENILKLKR